MHAHTKGTETKTRVVPWSYMMNVCTHSYSLVWYTWEDWQEFIDWMVSRSLTTLSHPLYRLDGLSTPAFQNPRQLAAYMYAELC